MTGARMQHDWAPGFRRCPMLKGPSPAATRFRPLKPSGIALTALIVFLLTIAFQPIEMSNRADGAGLAWLIRISAIVGFALMVLAVQGFAVRQSVWLSAVAVCGLFLLLNLRDMGQYGLMLVVSSATSVLAAMAITDRNSRLIEKCLTIYIVANIAGFVLAYAIVKTTGLFVDLHKIVFPYSEARLGLSFGQARVSGFHIEPGTYAQWTFIAVFVRSLLRGRVFDKLVLIYIATLLLTFSAWGVFALVGFGAAWLLGASGAGGKLGSNRPFVALISAVSVFIVAAIVFNSPYADYVQTRFTLADGSGVAKTIAVESLMSKLNQVVIFGEPVSRPFCPGCYSPQDIGIWSSFIYHIGLVPSVILLAIVFWALVRIWNLSYVPLFMVVLLSKAQLLEPLIWFSIALPLLALMRRKPMRWNARPPAFTLPPQALASGRSVRGGSSFHK